MKSWQIWEKTKQCVNCSRHNVIGRNVLILIAMLAISANKMVNSFRFVLNLSIAKELHFAFFQISRNNSNDLFWMRTSNIIRWFQQASYHFAWPRTCRDYWWFWIHMRFYKNQRKIIHINVFSTSSFGWLVQREFKWKKTVINQKYFIYLQCLVYVL